MAMPQCAKNTGLSELRQYYGSLRYFSLRTIVEDLAGRNGVSKLHSNGTFAKVVQR
jgi:hypothetical protein